MEKKETIKKRLIGFCLLIFFLVPQLGCDTPIAPMPEEDIEKIKSPEVRVAVSKLYQKKPAEVLRGMRILSENGNDAEEAVPHLVFLLTDKRIAKEKRNGIIAHLPLYKEAAITLCRIGTPGIHGLIRALEEKALSTDGIDDDFVREAASFGLNDVMARNLKQLHLLKGTEFVEILIQTTEICHSLSQTPERRDQNDPRRNLKLYKHFDKAETKEGLTVYIDALGHIGDTRALQVLRKIIPLESDHTANIPVDPFCREQRSALTAQYRIHPVPAVKMEKKIRRILMAELLVRKDSEKAMILAGDEAFDPDMRTYTEEPFVRLSFRKSTPVFEKLVARGANLDCLLKKKETMLIQACRDVDTELVKALLANGAKTELENLDGETAMAVTVSQVIDDWNRKTIDREVEPLFEIIRMLKKAGSPEAPEDLMERLDKKERKRFMEKTEDAAGLS